MIPLLRRNKDTFNHGLRCADLRLSNSAACFDIDDHGVVEVDQSVVRHMSLEAELAEQRTLHHCALAHRQPLSPSRTIESGLHVDSNANFFNTIGAFRSKADRVFDLSVPVGASDCRPRGDEKLRPLAVAKSHQRERALQPSLLRRRDDDLRQPRDRAHLSVIENLRLAKRQRASRAQHARCDHDACSRTHRSHVLNMYVGSYSMPTVFKHGKHGADGRAFDQHREDAAMHIAVRSK